MLCINHSTHLALVMNLNWGRAFRIVTMKKLEYELPESSRGLKLRGHFTGPSFAPLHNFMTQFLKRPEARSLT